MKRWKITTLLILTRRTFMFHRLFLGPSHQEHITETRLKRRSHFSMKKENQLVEDHVTEISFKTNRLIEKGERYELNVSSLVNTR